MTRTLIIEAAGNLRGSERALIDFVEVTSELEFAVCCPPRTPLCRELQKRHIRQLPYFVFGLHQKSRWRRLQAAIGVIRACLEFRPHVIHLNQGGAYKVTLPAARLLDLPIVAHVRPPARLDRNQRCRRDRNSTFPSAGVDPLPSTLRRLQAGIFGHGGFS